MGCDPRPLNWETDADATQSQRLRALTTLAKQAAEECRPRPKGTRAALVTLKGNLLVVQSDHDRTVDVPVLLSEVAYAHIDQGSERSVIALAPMQEPRASAGAGLAVWLLEVEGGERALRQQLRALGEQGALRGNLREEYTLAVRAFSSGVSGSVHEASDRYAPRCGASSERRFAAKVIPFKKKSGKRPKKADVDSEVALLALAQGHPNIIGFRGLFWCGTEEVVAEGPGGEDEGVDERAAIPLCGPCAVMLTDFCRNGDLFDWVRQSGQYMEGEALKLAMGLLSALAHVHHRRVVHRDVKSENVLIGNKGQPILTDFGIAALVTDEKAMSKRPGSPGYAAPELLQLLPYGRKVDTFAAGIVLYYALFGFTPFAAGMKELCIDKINQNTVNREVQFPRQPAISSQMKQFILILTTKDSEDRPTSKCAIDLAKLLLSPAAEETDAVPRASSTRCGRETVQEEAPPMPQEVGEERPSSSVAAKDNMEPLVKNARSEPQPTPVPEKVDRKVPVDKVHSEPKNIALPQVPQPPASPPAKQPGRSIFNRLGSKTSNPERKGRKTAWPSNDADEASASFDHLFPSESSGGQSPSTSRSPSPSGNISPLRRLMQFGSRRSSVSPVRAPAEPRNPAPAFRLTSMNPGFLRRRSKEVEAAE